MKKFLEDNPLCVCHEEITAIKQLFGESDDIKLKQKLSQVMVTLRELRYFVALRIHIGNDYPKTLTE